MSRDKEHVKMGVFFFRKNSFKYVGICIDICRHMLYNRDS